GFGAACAFAVLFSIVARQFHRIAEQNVRLFATAGALRFSEARCADFAQMSSDWLWELDAELRFTWVSDSTLLQAFGMSGVRAITPWEAHGEDPSRALWVQFRAIYASRRPFRDFRSQHIDAKGLTRSVSTNGC